MPLYRFREKFKSRIPRASFNAKKIKKTAMQDIINGIVVCCKRDSSNAETESSEDGAGGGGTYVPFFNRARATVVASKGGRAGVGIGIFWNKIWKVWKETRINTHERGITGRPSRLCRFWSPNACNIC